MAGTYGYLVWDLILGVFWALIYFSQKKIRRKILWGSILAFPFGLGELYFHPTYWKHPQTLFNLAANYNLDIESFLLMFFLGGLAAALYETFKSNYKCEHYKCCVERCYCYLSLAVTLTVFIVLTKMFPDWSIIYPSSVAPLAGGIFAFIVYPKLRQHIFAGGLLFMFLYLLSIAVTELLVPGWIINTWNFSILSGITILKVPIEELMFGFAFGTLWAPLYEEICSNFSAN